MQRRSLSHYPWHAAACTALFLLLALGAIALFLNEAADRENQLALHSSNTLAHTALSTMDQSLSSQLLDFSWWDAAAEQANFSLDPEWADDNLGWYLEDQYGYSGSYLVGADQTTLFAYSGEHALPETADEFFGDNKGAFYDWFLTTSFEEPIVRTGFVEYGGALFFTATAPITYEEPTLEQLKPHRRPLLTFHMPMDETRLKNMSEAFLLKNLRVMHGSDDAANAIGIDLMGLDGQPIGKLVWDQERPGDTMFAALWPRIALVSIILITAAAVVFIVWSRTAMAATKAKSQFLAKMSHELRTPLNPIIGFADMMRHEAAGPLPETYRTYASDISRSGRHLLSIVQGILDYSKIEAGDINLRESTFDVGDVAKKLPVFTRVLWNPESPEEGDNTIPINWTIAEDVPFLRADEIRVRQVLLNLVSNAAKFSNGLPIDGRIFCKDGSVCIEIEDHGPGISRQDLREVFKPFIQVGNWSAVQQTMGTGLGLCVARELMEMHDGTLELSSELGIGTTAIMAFPTNRSVPQ